jgi:hypothetical protein
MGRLVGERVDSRQMIANVELAFPSRDVIQGL